MRFATTRRALALGVIVASALATRVALGAEHPVTLDEAIEMALHKNENLIIERESLGAARADLTAAKGAYDPVLELDGSWSKATQPVTFLDAAGTPYLFAPEDRSTDAGLTLRQLLPTGGALSLRAGGTRTSTDNPFSLLSPAYDTRAGVELRQPLLRRRSMDAARLSVRVARAGHEGALASLRRTVTETVADVERAYWALTDVRREVDVQREAVHLAEQQLEDTRSRVTSGAAPRTEVAQPQAELERRRGELLAAGEALARAENALKVLVLDGESDAFWGDDLTPVEEPEVGADSAGVDSIDVQAALRRALERRPELDVANAQVKRRRAEAAYARDGVWPNLDVVLSYDRYGLAGSPTPAVSGGSLPSGLEGDLGDSFGSIGDGDYDEARVALVLGLPIGNREARGRAAAARHVEREAEAGVTLLRKTIRAEVLNAAAALQAARQRIDAAKAAREAAEIQLDAEKNRYATGLSTNFLVLTRQNDLSRARLDEISALTDYRTARTELARATGSLLERHHIGVGESTRQGERP